MHVQLLFSPSHQEAVNLIYAACRQCYSSGFVGDQYPFLTTPESKKEELIKRVVNSGHHSVLEHVSFTFAIEDLSRAAQQQLTRHRVASFCIAGDSLISTSSEKTNNKTIEYLYTNIKPQYQKLLKIRYLDEKTNELKYNSPINIVYSGIKPVYEIEVEHGYKIKTTLEHCFYIGNGEYKQLKDLIIGDRVYINGIPAYQDKKWLEYYYLELNELQNTIANRCNVKKSVIGYWVQKFQLKKRSTLIVDSSKTFKNKEWLNYQYNILKKTQGEIAKICNISQHTVRSWIRKFNLQNKIMGSWNIGREPPNKGKTKDNYEPMRILSEKIKNGEVEHYKFPSKHGINIKDEEELTKAGGYSRCHRSFQKQNQCEMCEKKTITEFHHKDKNPRNNNKDNIQELCIECHKLVHGKLLLQCSKPSKIISIKYVGNEKTYDIEMPGPNHNFVANGFIVHNSIQSTRYCNVQDMGYYTPDSIKKESQVEADYNGLINLLVQFYEENTENDTLPREDARGILPLNWYSNLVMTMNCRELLHFFSERLCTNAQKEIRELAKKMLSICQDIFPEVFLAAGPKCKSLGYCNEGARSCHRMPLKEEVFKIYNTFKELQKIE